MSQLGNPKGPVSSSFVFIRTQKKQLIIIEDKIEQRLQIGKRQLNDIRYNMHKKLCMVTVPPVKLVNPHTSPEVQLSLFLYMTAQETVCRETEVPKTVSSG